MKLKVSIKEGQETKILDEIVIKHEIKDMTALVLKADNPSEQGLEAFKKEWIRLTGEQSRDNIILAVPSDAEVEQLVFEAEVKSWTLKGTICAPKEDRQILESLGIKLGGYDEENSEFKDCKVSDEAMQKLNPYWDQYFWSLQ